MQPFLDQVAAAANALQNVLDVVRERGDRLPHGRQPLGLDHRRVVRRVLDRQRRLVADGDHQLQVLFGELVARSVAAACAGRRVGVDVDHADDAVPALHRHADRLAHAQLDDARRGSQRSSSCASLVSTPSLCSIT